jgi:hypothetical protein
VPDIPVSKIRFTPQQPTSQGPMRGAARRARDGRAAP